MPSYGTRGISKFWERGSGRGPWRKSGTLGTQMERVRMTKKLRGAGWTISYFDDITPSTMMVEFAMDEAMTAIAVQLGPIMALRMQEIYHAGGEPTWKPDSASWLAYKASGKSYRGRKGPFDLRTMHMTGDLEKEVDMLQQRLHTFYNSQTGQLVITGLDDAFSDAWYVWFHELSGIPTGSDRSGRLRRPFIMQAILESLRSFNMTGASFAQWADDQATKGLEDFHIKLVEAGIITPGGATPAQSFSQGASSLSTGVRIGTPGLGRIGPIEDVNSQYEWWKSKYKFGLMALLWWVLPPHKILAVYGAVMDLKAFATGELSDAFLKGWLFALAKGKAGGMVGAPTTRKMQRRAFRRRLWRGRS